MGHLRPALQATAIGVSGGIRDGGEMLGLADWLHWQAKWFEPDDCGPVAHNVVSVADNVVSEGAIESDNLVEKSR